MKDSVFTILSQKPLTDAVYELKLRGDASDVSAPGQCVNLRLDGL